MHAKRYSFRMQIFIYFSVFVIFPVTLLGLIMTNQAITSASRRQLESFAEVTNQINHQISSIIYEANKISTLHLLNDDIARIMVTNYEQSTHKYYNDFQTMKSQILLVNQLNPNVAYCIFYNKFGYSFEYNYNDYSCFQDTLADLDEWVETTRSSPNYTYIAPLQLTDSPAYPAILPMIKVLRNGYSSDEIGLFVLGINFNAIKSTLDSIQLSNNFFALYDEAGNLFYTTSGEKNQEETDFTAALEEARQQMDLFQPGASATISADGGQYFVHTVFNEAARWQIVHMIDDSSIQEIQLINIRNFLLLFLCSMTVALLLSMLISSKLSIDIRGLCEQLANSDADTLSQVHIKNCSNIEVNRIIESYNQLTQRLSAALEENFTIQLNEQRTHLKMLQAQINPHFLYNSLNLISSLANIHDIPEIRKVSMAISDLLRYNLKSGPIVTLGDEIENLNHYIAIQQYRFPNRFVFECAVRPGLEQASVPISILQPLVENSIIHGFEHTEENNYIIINIYCDSALHILIADNGCGIPPDRLARLNEGLKEPNAARQDDNNESIGLINVHQRIRNYFGSPYGVSVQSTVGKGTIVDIMLPAPAGES